MKVRALYHALPIVLAVHLSFHSSANPLTTVCLHSQPPAPSVHPLTRSLSHLSSTHPHLLTQPEPHTLSFRF